MFALVLAAVVAAQTAAQSLPAQFQDGRAFAQPIAVSSGIKLKLWIDSDGRGFLTRTLLLTLQCPLASSGFREFCVTDAYGEIKA